MASKKTDGKEIVLAVYNQDDVTGASQALLKADIDFVSRRIGSGSNGNFLMALNNYGEEFFVAPEDVDRAREVLAAWREQKAADREEELQQEVTDTAAENREKKQVLGARILAVVCLAIILFLYLRMRG